MKAQIEEAKRILTDFDQVHLLQFLDELSASGQKKLLNQISSIDLNLIKKLYDDLTMSHESKSFDQRNITPIHCDILENFNDLQLLGYQNTGINAIRKGKVACVTMAGGQGTRLGFSGPKGTFEIGDPINKTLFELQAAKLKDIYQKHGHWIPWYIMTSNENHCDTVKYFCNNNNLGYSEKDIFFFKQGMLPMVDFNGKILLKEKDEICFGSDGNGGIFLSLRDSGLLDDMNSRGVEWIYICGIDNALVNVADPIFIGYTIMSTKCSASKSVAKKCPDEVVGVFCLENGMPSIIEYSEIPEEQTKEKGKDGQLVFGDANIISHLFRLDDLIKIAEKGLPYHVAIKKTPCIDKCGRSITPQEPNAYKFESFIFDAFRYVNDMAILRVQREKEFAPIKNRIGADSPETAIKQLVNLSNNELY